jgi:hypothetical protein
MKVIKNTFVKGAFGLANVKVDETKKKVIVSFINGEHEGETYRLEYDDVPDVAINNGKFHCVMTGDGKKLLSYRPNSGAFKAKFVEFSRNDKGEIITGTKTNKFDTTYEYFLCSIEITDGKYQGMIVPYFLRSFFVNDGEGNLGVKGNTDKSPAAARLMEFLDMMGVIDMTIPWKEPLVELLKILEKKIQKKGHGVTILVKDGNIENMAAEEDEEEDAFEDEEDAPEVPPAKKSAKKIAEPDEDEEEDEPVKKSPAKKSPAKKSAPVDDFDEDEVEY